MICGLRVEVRGTAPEGEVIVCAKHQSFLDIMMLVHALPRPKFIMKKELRWAPILGLYALRIGSTPVERGAALEGDDGDGGACEARPASRGSW